MKNILIALSILLLASCTENYSQGERIGMITKFSKSGLMYDSWEGHLNATQTGMNSADPLDFSIDNDHEDPKVIATLDSAATNGWKVKIRYHETMGKNWFNNRGETDHFVTEVDVLDRDMPGLFGRPTVNAAPMATGKVDTVYVIVVPRSALKDFPQAEGQ
jgi:hypothetical protein